MNNSCLYEAVLNYPEMKNSQIQPTILCVLHSPRAVVTGISSLSTHMCPNGFSEPCTLQGRCEKTVFLRVTHRVREPFLPILWTCPSGTSCSLVIPLASCPASVSPDPNPAQTITVSKVWMKLRKLLPALKFSFFIMFTTTVFHLHSLLKLYQQRNKLNWNQYNQNYTLGNSARFNHGGLL